MVAPTQSTEFYRCAIVAENSVAVLQIRHRGRFNVKLQEASIDGFTVLVGASNASRLQIGEPWMMHYDGATMEVHAQWFFQSADGQVQVGLRRLRDLTRPPMMGGWFPDFFNRSSTRHDSGGSLLWAGGLLVMVMTLALPGIGDALGTSAKIQAVLNALCR